MNNQTCIDCAYHDINSDNNPICACHNSFIASPNYRCKDFLAEREGKAKKFTEWCSFCENETHYNFSDMDENFSIICKVCKESLLACDFCLDYSGRFCEENKCKSHLVEAKFEFLKEKNNARS